MIKISIIISTYGRIKYIPELVDALRPQLRENMEVIVVEGKDLKDYEALAENQSLQEINAKIYFLPRCTLPASRNFGAKKANGEWLVFSDDDDIFVDSKMKLFEEAIQADYLVYYSDYFVFDERVQHNGSGLRMVVDFKKIAGKVSLFLSNIISGGSAFMVHSSVIKMFPFDESLRGAEDHDFWRRIMLNNIPIYFIDRKLTGYRSHGQNMTKAHMKSLYHEFVLFKKYLFSSLFFLFMVFLSFIKLFMKSFFSIYRMLKQKFLNSKNTYNENR